MLLPCLCLWVDRKIVCFFSQSFPVPHSLQTSLPAANSLRDPGQGGFSRCEHACFPTASPLRCRGRRSSRMEAGAAGAAAGASPAARRLALPAFSTCRQPRCRRRVHGSRTRCRALPPGSVLPRPARERGSSRSRSRSPGAKAGPRHCEGHGRRFGPAGPFHASTSRPVCAPIPRHPVRSLATPCSGPKISSRRRASCPPSGPPRRAQAPARRAPRTGTGRRICRGHRARRPKFAGQAH